MTTTTRPDYDTFKANQTERDNLLASRVRCTPMWLLHLFTFPPIVSVIYCSKINYWKPAIFATATACLTVPLDLAGTVFITGVVPPLISAGMINARVRKSREDLGIMMPDEADRLIYNRKVD